MLLVFCLLSVPDAFHPAQMPEGMLPAKLDQVERQLREEVSLETTADGADVVVMLPAAWPTLDAKLTAVWKVAGQTITSTAPARGEWRQRVPVGEIHGELTVDAATKIDTRILTCGESIACNGNAVKVETPNIESVRFLDAASKRLRVLETRASGEVVVQGDLYQVVLVTVLQRERRIIAVRPSTPPRADIPISISTPRRPAATGSDPLVLPDLQAEKPTVTLAGNQLHVTLPDRSGSALCTVRLDPAATAEPYDAIAHRISFPATRAGTAHVRCPRMMPVVQLSKDQLSRHGVSMRLEKNHVHITLGDAWRTATSAPDAMNELLDRPAQMPLSVHYEPVRAYDALGLEMRKLQCSPAGGRSMQCAFWGEPARVQVLPVTHWADVQVPFDFH